MQVSRLFRVSSPALLARALLFSLLLSAPYLFECVRSAGYSVQIFSDWDEPLYLPDAVEASSVPWTDLFRLQHGVLRAYLTLNARVPHAAANVLAGKAAHALALSPVQLGLLLDLICCFLSYLAFVLFFRKLVRDPAAAELAAFSALGLPWLISLPHAAAPMSFGRLTLAYPAVYPCPPVLRAVFTQLSCPVFGLALFLGVRALRERRGWPAFAAAGAAAGSLPYLYFFAWPPAILVVALFACGAALLGDTYPLRTPRLWMGLLVFVLAACVTALPALDILFLPGELFAPGARPVEGLAVAPLDYRRYWYLPVVSVLLLALVSLRLLRLRARTEGSAPDQRALLTLAAAVLAAEPLLANAQPAAGRFMSVFHFQLHYLYPLLSGALVGIVCLLLHRRRLRTWCGTAIVGAVLAAAAGRFVQFAAVGVDRAEEQALFTYIARHIPQDARLAALPFEQPFAGAARELRFLILPYAVEALTGRKVISKFLGYAGEREPLLQKEFAHGLLFAGVPRLVGPCPDRLVLPGDLFTGNAAFETHLRMHDCALARRAPPPDACILIRQFPVDYLIVEAGAAEPRWWGSPAAQVEWTSPGNRFRLIKVHKRQAEDYFCGQSEMRRGGQA